MAQVDEEGHRVVSIHAPAWGATSPEAGPGWGRSVSIHAPAWGATPERRGPGGVQHGFNPRPRVGGRPQDLTGPILVQRLCVSIHAPAWGATGPSPSSWGLSGIYSFQSTPPRGGRRISMALEVSPGYGVSIHAPAWGGDPALPAGLPCPSRCRFNPRPRVGGDQPEYLAKGSMVVRGFNPRPRVGGDVALRVRDQKEA